MYLNLKSKLPYAYVQEGRLCIKRSSLRFINEDSDTMIPSECRVLFIGPKTSITNYAIKRTTWSGCTIIWVGKDISESFSIYSFKEKSSEKLLKQIHLLEHKKNKLLKRYLNMRIEEKKEIKKEYISGALKYGAPYSGRHIIDKWNRQTAYNNAISIISSFLHTACNVAISSLGYSSALGINNFFIYDIVDLYKINFSIPLGFEVAKSYNNKEIDNTNFERAVIKKAAEKFHKENLFDKIISDIEILLAL